MAELPSRPLTLISPASGTAIAALAGCLLLYLAYKLFYRPDFGMPVRRRILPRAASGSGATSSPIVPVWWSDLQVQRAISGHWKQEPARHRDPPGSPGAS